jgi:hypothetical protein
MKLKVVKDYASSQVIPLMDYLVQTPDIFRHSKPGLETKNNAMR